MASSRLVTLGKNIKEKAYSFSAFTGAMVLTVTGLESFLNSIAYYIALDEDNFIYDEFEFNSLLNKLDFIIAKYDINLKKGERPYQTAKVAIKWRNSIAHSKPTFVNETELSPGADILKLPKQYISSKYKYDPYEQYVTEINADRYNRDIIEIIEKIIEVSGINPRANCTYHHD